MIEVLSIIAMVMGIIMSASGIPQIYKSYKRRSSKDVSIVMILIFLFGVVIWTIYGASINNYVIIIPNIVGIFVWSITLFAVLKYRK